MKTRESQFANESGFSTVIVTNVVTFFLREVNVYTGNYDC